MAGNLAQLGTASLVRPWRDSLCHAPTARRARPDDGADDDRLGPLDPDLLDDEEPQPEPGDFWFDRDDDET